MYRTIYVPVDNSDHSNRAVATAVRLAKAFESTLVGCHVYAAKMHDYRFKQMEYTLPEEYLDEVELERQRKIHDSLITMGLKLISDSYLERMRHDCLEAGVPFEPRMIDGKHATELVRDIRASGYDLVVIGALGMGRVKDSQIGSVCERVARAVDRDVLVVKHLPEPGEPERDTILVGIDGSPQSFGALVTALDLASRCGKTVEIIAVYDPYLHYSVFSGIVDVLTEKAAKVFRFEEQNQLHEEIIDTGLAQIYQSHLDVAERMAAERGVAVKKTLLDGKAFQKVLDHARATKPWLLVLGRVGVHHEDGETGLGSNTENLLRSCPCDVLLTTRLERPSLDVKAEESVRWTPEAEAMMERAPRLVRGIARTAVLRLAVEKGHSVVSRAVIEEAMARYMPGYTARETRALAGAVAVERARSGGVAVCRACGVTAAEAAPVRCAVCQGTDFEAITPEMVEAIAKLEGDLMEDVAYDGRRLEWTSEAKLALRAIPDHYKRRRAKARIEKSARTRRLPAITLEFCRQVIEDETGAPLEELPRETTAPTAEEPRTVATDARGVPLKSTYAWTPEAAERLLRVPAGFMRSRTQERIEKLAWERGAGTIDLALVEEGVEIGRQMMAAMLTSYAAAGAREDAAGSRDAAAGTSAVTDGTYPVAGPPEGNGEGTCPVERPDATAPAPAAAKAPADDRRSFALNEIGVMNEMARKRGGVR